jgi:hypothetical protein
MSAPCFNRACIASGMRRLARRSRNALNSTHGAEASLRNYLIASPLFAVSPTRYSGTNFMYSCLRGFSSISTIENDVDEFKGIDHGDGCIEFTVYDK